MQKLFKILVVEDDPTLRDTLKAILLTNNYDVYVAENGQVAKQFLLLEKINFILSDIEMPHFSGIDLLEWVKKNRPTPMMLMTGFSRILETKTAAELGADEFLAKPFSIDELLAKISKYVGETNSSANTDKTKVDDLDAEFCKVPIEDFISEKDTDYGVFVRISNTRYIKIAHQGGKLSPDKIDALKAKGVTYLYIKKEDFPKLVGFTVLVSKAMNNVAMPSEKRLRFMRYTGEVVLEQIFVDGINEQSFRASKDFVMTTIDMVTKDDDISKTLELLNQHSDYLYSHSVAVSLFSVMIAHELGYKTPQILFKVALGGLLHDVGKKEIPKEILEKPRHAYSSDDVKLLESHVKRGKEILEEFRGIPSDIVHIVSEHHEDQLGQGYPRGLNGPRIHPLAQIVSVADIFCEYTIKESPHSQIISPQSAITKMNVNRIDSINKMALSCLQRLVCQAG